MPERNLKSPLLRNILKSASVMVGLAILVVVLLVSLFMRKLINGLPDVATLRNFHHELSTEVFSDDGRKIGEFTAQRRYPVEFASIPKHVIHAFLAAEDSKFYEHGGVDFSGIFRALISNLVKGRYAQGGSTITQQVARALLLEDKKKEITRKIREMILARRMEKELTKNDILGLYLSEIYLGHGAWGIGAAALNYFGKKVADLNLAEASLLAGLPQRPNEWDPFKNPYLAKRRQLYVIKRMVEEKFISEAEGREAMVTPIKLYTLEELNNKVAPYFTEYVRQYLMKKYGSDNILSRGYKVYTTVRYDYQKTAERAMDRGLRGVDKRLGWRGVHVNLETQQKVDTFLATVHEEVLDKITRVRVLQPNADQGTKKLQYDLTAFQDPKSPYFGPTPLREGEFYKAVITQVDDGKGAAVARVGQTAVILPLATMDWVKFEGKPLKSISKILKPGDVTHVKVDKIERRENAILASLEQEPEIQGAFLSYDIHNGFVQAMVGGKSFDESKFNRALHAKRQVGSTFKPLVYAAAIDKGFSPSSIVTDSPIVFKFDAGTNVDPEAIPGEDWRPKNYGGKFEGDIPIRMALIRSMNIPTVKILNEIGVDYGIQYARTLGITAPLQRDLSIALGSWSSSLEELMRAYAVFPRLGRPLVLNYIKKVVDGSGKVLEELPAEKAAPVPGEIPEVPSGTVISPQTAYVMIDMLKGVVREGTGHGAAMGGVPIAGKTGTTSDHRDAWFVGFSPHILTGVWIGFDKDRPLDPGETGGRAATPIFAEYMSSAMKDYPAGDFAVPDDIVFAYVEKDTGKLASSQTQNRVRVAFKVGSVPNRAGDNIPRIGEPGGSRATTTEDPTAKPREAPKQDETSDFLRDGYQD